MMETATGNAVLPLWIVDALISRAIEIDLSGIVNGEFRVVDGHTLPRIHTSQPLMMGNAPVTLNVEISGIWIKLPLTDAVYTSENYSDSMKALSISTTAGVTVRIVARLY